MLLYCQAMNVPFTVFITNISKKLLLKIYICHFALICLVNENNDHLENREGL
jgi:hypothetical protein